MEDGIKYIESFPEWTGEAGFGVDTIKAVLGYLGNPQDKPRSIHVAGTNGKGSVCIYLSSIINKLGFSVGLTTSPHLTDIRERFIINGKIASKEAVSEAALDVKKAIEETDSKLSHFEVVIATAFQLFKDLDFIVVETGLGGRLDATNTLKSPEICIITSISRDHEDILGNSIEEIAREKAGIIKPSAKVIISDLDQAADKVIRERSLDNELYALGKDFDYFAGKGVSYQKENLSLAAFAGELLGAKQTEIEEAIARVYLPARLETIVYRNKEFILDSAHNVAACEALVNHLLAKDINKIDIVFGTLEKKNWREMIRVLKDYIGNWNIVQPISGRAEKCENIQEELLKNGISNFKIYGKNYSELIESLVESDGDQYLVTGSIFILGEVLNLIKREPLNLW